MCRRFAQVHGEPKRLEQVTPSPHRENAECRRGVEAQIHQDIGRQVGGPISTRKGKPIAADTGRVGDDLCGFLG